MGRIVAGFLLLPCILFCALPGLAQDRTLTGIIRDSTSGQPIAGASVAVKGMAVGTTSAADGTWRLRAATADPVLVFSFVGYRKQEFRPGVGSDPIVIRLVADGATLNAMVVTGYTRQSKVKTVGALTTIPGTALQDVPVASFDVMLQGRVPGLYVGTPTGQPGEAGRVTLRGMGSINGDVQPLYLVDGVQVSNTVFSGLNTNDFESVVVLKDAASTAQYGSRAANGVVVITTRNGKSWEDGRSKVEFNSYFGASQVNSSKWNMMNTSQRLRFEAMVQDPNLPGWEYSSANPWMIVNGATVAKTAADYAYGNAYLDSLRRINTDWRKVLLRTGITQSDAVSLSGGKENTSYYLALAYLNQQGVALNSGIERYSVRGNIQNTTGRLRTSLNLGLVQDNISFIQDEGTAPAGGASAGGGGIAANNPIAALFFALPYEKPDAAATGPGNYGSDALNEYNNSSLKDNQLEGVLSLNEAFRLTHELQLTGMAGLSYQQDRITDYLAPNSYFGQQVSTGNSGMYQDSLTIRYHFVENAGIRYLTKWGDDNELEANLLFEGNRNYATYNGYTGYGLQSQLGNTGAAITQGSATNNDIPIVAGGTVANNLLVSEIALLRYSLGSKYTVTADLRRDGSSQVPANNRYIDLYAIGGKWNILAEHFMDGVSFLSALRLRGSYGLTANAGGFSSDFGYQTLYGTASYGGSPALVPQTPGNSQYNWEYSRLGDVGLEFGFLHNRIYGELDGYNRVTDNLFVNRNLSLTTGWPSVAANLGRVRNRGVELGLNGEVIKTTDLRLSVGVNFAYNRNTVLSLGGVNQQFIDQVSLNQVGKPLGTFYAVRWAGVDPQSGAPVYLDAGGKATPVYDAANAVTLKSTWDPPVKGGISLDLGYRRFEASVLISFIRGMSRLNYPYMYSHSADPNYRYFNQSADMLQLWQKPGDVSAFQGAAYTTQLSSQYVQSSDYTKLRNVSLSYSLRVGPGMEKVVRAFKVFVQGQNLISRMKWKGFDPEDANDIAQYEYPMPRTITAGVNVSF